MNAYDRLISTVRAEFRLDARTSVFDVHPERRNGSIVLRGETTENAAAKALLTRAAELGSPVDDEIVRLPDPQLGDQCFAVVRAAVAPVCERPHLATALVSQVVLGQTLQILSRHEWWFRVRGQDNYIGWINRGFLCTGSSEWARKWERGVQGTPVFSLGAELRDDDDAVLARAPWGARLVRVGENEFEVPDGRTGHLGSGELLPLTDLPDRFPLTGESIVRTARRWLGAPYLWGGVTPGGVDCSGLVQAVYRVHGITMPRDSSLQALVGDDIDVSETLGKVRPGDLFFFMEVPECITHVGISLGGARMLHSSVGNGGVAINDLNGDAEIERRLRGILVRARRILPRE